MKNEKLTKEEIVSGIIGWTIFIVAIIVVMVVFPKEDKLTHNDCLQIGKFKYENKCVDYKDIPVSHHEKVWDEVATEIARSRGISKEQALREILRIMEDN
ncbi:hypothetical protein PQE75_gp093 [Bacillus phage vB_BcoS-136]|uniref:Uncharacterized protein n=1 Tax=Bacillus phage vB_BcoS-136 TaxID=2419619 RepID=A0A3G3BVE6_9CAUD|nr:hypothetical protein PQE75_gp093 [Bacillus phage vB_BcoS-136]AYP68225.1 hypothetical protein vBBcoS136_00093 [Bacillus phage vB_BcoS-136]